ncbi:MAG: hypothetical protein CMG13_03080 [Candidatus Marinimicrobia bacterium]|nr:hypothetical protein [Candidatus Neomarinimicrobiota bacterium]|tara:strand:- start:6768 stop:8471 length:1704 start_codon:yes stop_codon:yes gene_type:complete
MTKLYKIHQKRIRFIVLGVLLLISITTAKTLYIQVFKSKTIENYVSREAKGERGIILDRNGVKLAYDAQFYDLFLSKEDSAKFGAVEYFVKEYFDRNIDIDSLANRSKQSSFRLVKKVPKRRIIELKSILAEYPCIEKSMEYTDRYYPKKDLGSQLIGKFSHTKNKKGLWGVEYFMDDSLKGGVSTMPFFITSRGFRKEDFSEEEFEKLSGSDITLTIDVEYQRILEQELAGQLKKTNSRTANGIIVNPYNGEILALASVPGSDLNKGLSSEEQSRDYSTSYNYEPGSTLKPFSILAGLKENKITLSDKYYCEKGEYFIPNISRKIIDHDPNDTLTVKEVLAYSSNIGMAKISLKVGKESIYKTLNAFGFGEKTGISSYKEEKGYLKSIQDWNEHSRISISIGQEVNATNLQLAMAYSAIANGGYLLKPKIIKKISAGTLEEEPISIVRKVASREHLDLLIEALKMTVTDGTASSMFSNDFCSYGKTGTSQVFDSNENKYSDSIFVASYAGVFPCDSPKLVCIISFLEPEMKYRWATQTAVPVVEKVLNKILIKDKGLAIAVSDEIK